LKLNAGIGVDVTSAKAILTVYAPHATVSQMLQTSQDQIAADVAKVDKLLEDHLNRTKRVKKLDYKRILEEKKQIDLQLQQLRLEAAGIKRAVEILNKADSPRALDAEDANQMMHTFLWLRHRHDAAYRLELTQQRVQGEILNSKDEKRLPVRFCV